MLKAILRFCHLRIYIGVLSWYTPRWQSRHSTKHLFCRLGVLNIILYVVFCSISMKCNSQLMRLSFGAKSKFQILLIFESILVLSHVDQGYILHISYNIFLHFGGVKHHCCMLLFSSCHFNCNSQCMRLSLVCESNFQICSFKNLNTYFVMM